jgi:hypothetical protein
MSFNPRVRASVTKRIQTALNALTTRRQPISDFCVVSEEELERAGWLTLHDAIDETRNRSKTVMFAADGITYIRNVPLSEMGRNDDDDDDTLASLVFAIYLIASMASLENPFSLSVIKMLTRKRVGVANIDRALSFLCHYNLAHIDGDSLTGHFPHACELGEMLEYASDLSQYGSPSLTVQQAIAKLSMEEDDDAAPLPAAAAATSVDAPATAATAAPPLTAKELLMRTVTVRMLKPAAATVTPVPASFATDVVASASESAASASESAASTPDAVVVDNATPVLSRTSTSTSVSSEPLPTRAETETPVPRLPPAVLRAESSSPLPSPPKIFPRVVVVSERPLERPRCESKEDIVRILRDPAFHNLPDRFVAANSFSAPRDLLDSLCNGDRPCIQRTVIVHITAEGVRESQSPRDSIDHQILRAIRNHPLGHNDMQGCYTFGRILEANFPDRREYIHACKRLERERLVLRSTGFAML